MPPDFDPILEERFIAACPGESRGTGATAALLLSHGVRMTFEEEV